MISLIATPLDWSIESRPFIFTSFEEYEKKAIETKKRYNVDEFEITLNNGDQFDYEFAQLVEPDQSNINIWFDQLLRFYSLTDYKKAQITFLLERQYFELEYMLDDSNDIEWPNLYQGNLEDCACDEIKEIQDISEFLLRYFDYNAVDYIVTNLNHIQ